MTDRSALIHSARVFLNQSRHFTALHRGWSFTLLEWAGIARRRAAAIKESQMEMF
jgi:sugar phosphate permease